MGLDGSVAKTTTIRLGPSSSHQLHIKMQCGVRAGQMDHCLHTHGEKSQMQSSDLE